MKILNIIVFLDSFIGKGWSVRNISDHLINPMGLIAEIFEKMFSIYGQSYI